MADDHRRRSHQLLPAIGVPGTLIIVSTDRGATYALDELLGNRGDGNQRVTRGKLAVNALVRAPVAMAGGKDKPSGLASRNPRSEV